MATGISRSYPECKFNLRFAVTVCRDYGSPEGLDECNFTSNYTGPFITFSRALAQIQLSWGLDYAEDVFTGLENAAKLDSRALNRLLVHIGDAPCHGVEFHGGAVNDDYPGGDKYGRSIVTILRRLRQTCRVTRYFFCHISTYTHRMIEEFRKDAGTDDWIEEWQINDLDKVPEKVITASRAAITEPIRLVQHGVTGKQIYVAEKVDPRIPDWNRVRVQEATEFVHCEAGNIRYPYYAQVKRRGTGRPVRLEVVKRFKTELGKPPSSQHTKQRYNVQQMEVQTVSRQLAQEFNKCTSHLTGVPKVKFTEVTLLETDRRKILHEREAAQGRVDTVLQQCGILRGLKVRDASAPSQYVFLLCDPAIHTNDANVLKFTNTNFGEHGCKLFLQDHECNDVCRHLQLPTGVTRS
ncbi:hypothetical protein R1sor_022407 [Riccia sorocarpa]|uniref:Alpha-type protein kinase domain-containing protein n=1 Tax=Riccia sorocarpa TaxID=122646 RepID=A0ABD3GNL1_9MARC